MIELLFAITWLAGIAGTGLILLTISALYKRFERLKDVAILQATGQSATRKLIDSLNDKIGSIREEQAMINSVVAGMVAQDAENNPNTANTSNTQEVEQILETKIAACTNDMNIATANEDYTAAEGFRLIRESMERRLESVREGQNRIDPNAGET